jgi:hypothetical protein
MYNYADTACISLAHAQGNRNGVQFSLRVRFAKADISYTDQYEYTKLSAKLLLKAGDALDFIERCVQEVHKNHRLRTSYGIARLRVLFKLVSV